MPLISPRRGPGDLPVVACCLAFGVDSQSEQGKEGRQGGEGKQREKGGKQRAQEGEQKMRRQKMRAWEREAGRKAQGGGREKRGGGLLWEEIQREERDNNLSQRRRGLRSNGRRKRE